MSEQRNAAPDRDSMVVVLRDGAFEDALAALESVVGHLERGQLAIDEAVDWYEVGLALAYRCSEILQQAELRISSLEESYEVNMRGNNSDPSGF